MKKTTFTKALFFCSHRKSVLLNLCDPYVVYKSHTNTNDQQIEETERRRIAFISANGAIGQLQQGDSNPRLVASLLRTAGFVVALSNLL